MAVYWDESIIHEMMKINNKDKWCVRWGVGEGDWGRSIWFGEWIYGVMEEEWIYSGENWFFVAVFWDDLFICENLENK